MLEGAPGAFRDTVLMNAGAGLVVAAKTAKLAEGIAMAGEAIDNGQAVAVLDRLIAVSNR